MQSIQTGAQPSRVKFMAYELMTKNEKASSGSDIHVSVDKDNVTNFSVRYGSIGNRVNDLKNSEVQELVFELETQIKAKGNIVEIHWPSSNTSAASYNAYKRHNYL